MHGNREHTMAGHADGGTERRRPGNIAPPTIGRGLALALLFLAELAAWTAIGVATWQLFDRSWPGAIAGVAAVAITLIAWGLLASPKSKAPRAVKVTVRILVYAIAVALLAATGAWILASTLALLIGIAEGVAVGRLYSPGLPASVTLTSMLEKFFHEREAVGPRWPR